MAQVVMTDPDLDERATSPSSAQISARRVVSMPMTGSRLMPVNARVASAESSATNYVEGFQVGER